MKYNKEKPTFEVLFYILIFAILFCLILMAATVPFACFGFITLMFLSVFDVGPDNITYWNSFITGVGISIITTLLSSPVVIVRK